MQWGLQEIQVLTGPLDLQGRGASLEKLGKVALKDQWACMVTQVQWVQSEHQATWDKEEMLESEGHQGAEESLDLEVYKVLLARGAPQDHRAIKERWGQKVLGACQGSQAARGLRGL